MRAANPEVLGQSFEARASTPVARASSRRLFLTLSALASMQASIGLLAQGVRKVSRRIFAPSRASPLVLLGTCSPRSQEEKKMTSTPFSGHLRRLPDQWLAPQCSPRDLWRRDEGAQDVDAEVTSLRRAHEDRDAELVLVLREYLTEFINGEPLWSPIRRSAGNISGPSGLHSRVDGFRAWQRWARTISCRIQG